MFGIAVIPGDGIGAEVTAEVVKVLRTVAARTVSALDTVEWDLGADRNLCTCVTITPAGMRASCSGTTRSFSGAVGGSHVPDNAHARDILLVCRALREIVS